MDEADAGEDFGSNGLEVDELEVDDLEDGELEDGSDRPDFYVDLAADALQTARAMTSGSSRGATDPGPGRRRGSAGRPRRFRVRGIGAIYTSARPDDRDPMAIGQVVRQAAESLGWSQPLARARVLGQWEELVGAAIAARCQPVSLNGTELRVSAESTAWATQLRLMAPQILGRICSELPPGTVTKIVFTGPTGPSWRRGPWSMHGGRGVRDTYG